jgi:hypothetical protein
VTDGIQERLTAASRDDQRILAALLYPADLDRIMVARLDALPDAG